MKKFYEPILSEAKEITASAALEIDLALSNNFIINLTRNIVVSFKNKIHGCEYKFIFFQDTTGGRTVTDSDGNQFSISADPEAATIVRMTSLRDKTYFEPELKYFVIPTAKRVAILNILDISATFRLRTSEDCTVYWAVLASGIPTKEQIVAGTGAVDYGSIAAIGGEDSTDDLETIDPNTDYVVYYYMEDEDGNESAVLSTTFTTLLETPVITATANGTDTIDVTWPNVTGNEGYEIEASDDEIVWETPIVLDQDAVSYSETDLEPETTRYYRLKALGDGETTFDSPVSAESHDTTDTE